MKTLKGEFTVEAAILIPLLIWLILASSFLVIYAYDRALIAIDINMLASELRNSESECKRKCLEIEEQHPYIGVTPPKVYLTNDKDKYEISIRCEWVIPVWSQYKKELKAVKNVKVTDPIELMRSTKDLIEEMEDYKKDED